MARLAEPDSAFLDGLRGPMERAARSLDERGVRKSLPDTELVETAAKLVHARGPDSPMLQLGQDLEWRLGSGSAHGQLLVSMHRMGGHRTEGNVAMFGGNYDDVAQAVCLVSLLANEAWRIWDLRRQC